MSPYDPNSRDAKFSAFENHPITFLDGDSFRNKVSIVSYSRSGNTLQRTLLEKITKIFTGAAYEVKNITLNF